MSKILVSGGLVPTTKDTLLDARTRVTTFSDIANIENPARFMVITVEDTGKKYEVKKLSSKIIGGIVVENSTIDINDPEALVDLGLAEELRSEDEKVRQSNEKKRIEAENLRKSAEDSRNVNETNRVSAEGVREASERTRVSSEETRNANEQTRNSNETKRQSQESTRQSQESARQTNESARKTNESARKEAESERKTKETSRRTAELSRSSAENERVKNEQNRTTAENTRSSAEDRRVVNETQRTTNETARSNAELSREQAEGNRASTFNTLKGEMQSAITAGNAAAGNAQKVVDEYDEKVAEQDSKLSELGSEVNLQTNEIKTFKEAVTNQVNNYKPIEIHGDVTNAADEEDLTSDENNLLKLKNRNNLNGMGYIILRQNKTFAEQLTQTNTIYEIRYDFDLNGEEVAIPKGCTLKIEGGCLVNGGIVGNYTEIIYCNGVIDVLLKGSFLNQSFPLTWFGAIPSTPEYVIDVTNCLNLALSCSGETKVPILVPSGTFFHTGVIMPESSSLIGESINNSVLRLISTSNNSNITIINNSCQVSNLTICGNGRHLFFGDVYEEHNGNGICICAGSRLGYISKECINTKLFNLIITKCGNNGLAIVDSFKWVYNFENITINHCGNIGLYDKSTDNNFVGFNISHCQNVGLYVYGSRNRYSTFKVFVCGYDYRNKNEDGSRPSSIYWQGVRIKGSHNSLVSFDIQECGGELLYVEDPASFNYIQASLDRAGFGAEVVDSFSPYDVRGTANILIMALLKATGYNQKEGYCTGSSYILLAENALGVNRVLKKGITDSPQTEIHPSIGGLCTNEGSFINKTSISEYVSFNGKYSSIKKTTNFPINKYVNNGFNKAVAFRLHDTREDKSVRRNNNVYVVFEPYKTIQLTAIENSNGMTIELIQNGLFRYSNTIPVSDYYDIYWTIVKNEIFAIVRNKEGNIGYATSEYDSSEYSKAVSFRFGAMDVSNIHFVDGMILFPLDIESTFGTTYPMKEDENSAMEWLSGGSERPKTNTLGYQYFDVTLNKPIYWTGSAWVDATGVVV